MDAPYTLMMKWVPQEQATTPWVEDTTLAGQVLTKSTDRKIDHFAVPPALQEEPHLRTVVVVLMPVKNSATALRYEPDHVDAFTLAQWVLFDVLRSVRMFTRLPIADLTVNRLPAVIPCTRAHVENGRLVWSGEQKSIMHDKLLRMGQSADMLSHNDIDTVMGAFGNITWGRRGAIILDHLCRANASAATGDDIGAALAYATATEVAIVDLVLALLWESGAAPEESAEDLRNEGVTKLVTSRCSSLGGKWRTDQAGPVRDWSTDVAELRNRVIHDGYLPSDAEIDKSRAAALGILQHIAKRLVIKAKVYPKTTSIFASEQSVQMYASKRSREETLATIRRLSPTSEGDFADMAKSLSSSEIV